MSEDDNNDKRDLSDEEFDPVSEPDDDEVDSNVDDEDDEEEDEDDGRPSKSSRFKGHDFFMMEAEVDNDADEEEELIGDDDELDDVEPNDRAVHAADAARDYHRKIRRSERSLDDLDNQELEDYYVNRYGRGNEELELSDLDFQSSDIGRPSESNVFAVKCRMGEERTTAQYLMEEFMNQRDTPTAPIRRIRSIMVRDGVRGYIYVEAISAYIVAQALADIPSVANRLDQMQRIQQKHVSQLLKIRGEEIAAVHAGSYVRVTVGQYKGDLALVDSVDKDSKNAKVKIVPRINYEKKTKSTKRSAEQQSELTCPPSVAKGLRFGRGGYRRPPPRLLNTTLLASLGLEVKFEHQTIVFNKQHFSRTGLLLKAFPLHQLKTVIDKNEIQSNEIEPFKYEATTVAEFDEDDRRKVDVAQDPLKIGQKIILEEGELKDQIGVVVDVDARTSLIKIRVANSEMRVRREHLQQAFSPGDQVIMKKQNNDFAMVVTADRLARTASVLCDRTMTQVDVVWKDLRMVDEAKDKKSEVDEQGKFAIGDMVSISGGNQFGIVLDVNKDMLNVLTGFSTDPEPIQMLPRSTISSMDQRGQAFACDANETSFRQGDMVYVKRSGPDYGKRALVRYITKDDVFVQFNDSSGFSKGFTRFVHEDVAIELKEPDGPGDEVFAAFAHLRKVSQRTLDESESQGFLSRMASLRGNRRSRPPGRSRIGGGGGERSHFRRDFRILGKHVRISNGPFKGYMGMIKDANDDMIRVELQTVYQTLPFKRNEVTFVENSDLSVDFQSAPADTQTAMKSPVRQSLPAECPTPFNVHIGTPMTDLYGMTGSGDDWNPQDMLTPGFCKSPGTPFGDEGTDPFLAKINHIEPKTPAFGALVSAPHDSSYGQPIEEPAKIPQRESSKESVEEGYGQPVQSYSSRGQTDSAGYGQRQTEDAVNQEEISDDWDSQTSNPASETRKREYQQSAAAHNEDGYGRPVALNRFQPEPICEDSDFVRAPKQSRIDRGGADVSEQSVGRQQPVNRDYRSSFDQNEHRQQRRGRGQPFGRRRRRFDQGAGDEHLGRQRRSRHNNQHS